MNDTKSRRTGFSLIISATGAFVVAALAIKEVYNPQKLPVGSAGMTDPGFLLVIGTVLTLWSLGVVLGLTELVEVESDG